jgi:hypothetical protein
MGKTYPFCNNVFPVIAFVYDLALDEEICVGCCLKHLIRIGARPEVIQYFMGQNWAELKRTLDRIFQGQG